MTITRIQYRWHVLPTSLSESPIKCKNSVNVCLCACINPVGDSVDTNTLLLISPITGVSRQLLYLCCHSSSRALWASQWGYEERKSCSSGKHTEIGTLGWACLSLSCRSTGLYITPGTGTEAHMQTKAPWKANRKSEQPILARKLSWSHIEKSRKVSPVLTLQRGHWICSVVCHISTLNKALVWLLD